jgi:hypothetical protein
MKSFLYPEMSTGGKLIKDVTINLQIPTNKIEQSVGTLDKIITETSTDFTINNLLQENNDGLYLESSDEGLLGNTSSLTTETINIKPNPFDSEPDDDFGFSVTIDGTDVGEEWI